MFGAIIYPDPSAPVDCDAYTIGRFVRKGEWMNILGPGTGRDR